MTGKQESQLKSRAYLAERMLTAAEKANAQLEGTLATFTLVLASIALKYGGKFEITEEEINVASGVEFTIDKREEERTIVLLAGDSINAAKKQIDDTYVPDKLCPFIMEDGITHQEPPAPAIQLTDL